MSQLSVTLAYLVLSRIENLPLPLKSGDRGRFYFLMVCEMKPSTDRGQRHYVMTSVCDIALSLLHSCLPKRWIMGGGEKPIADGLLHPG